MTTARGYIWPYLDPKSKLYRPNLTVVTGVHVSRIVFQNRRVLGVAYLLGGSKKEEIVKVRKEVILSAGAVQTPQILMLSGVGAKEELSKHNIPVVANVPGVGKNLQDREYPSNFDIVSLKRICTNFYDEC